MSFADAFADRTVRTHELFERAKRTIPGGAGSTARLPRNGWKPYPLFMAEGNGSRLTDVDGNTYVDYLLGLGARAARILLSPFGGFRNTFVIHLALTCLVDE